MPMPSVHVLGLNYPPEQTGISPYTGSMARGLARRGFHTRVVTTHPHYPDWKIKPGYGQWSLSEDLDGVSVERLLHYVPERPKGIARAFSELTFGLRSAGRRWGDPAAIVVVSPALISSLVSVLRAKLTHRSTPLVVWVQDIYSLGLVETGQASGRTVQLMTAIEGWLLRQADRVVVIHDRFAARVSENFGVPRERIEVIRNWTHLPTPADIDVSSARRRLGWSEEQTIVLHAGNMGVKQGLENVVDAARLAEEQNVSVKFVLLGNGSERSSLQELSKGLSNVEFLDSLDDEGFAMALASADVLLVNERPGVSEMAVPSKLTSYFSAKRPVIAATDLNGITAEEVRSADAGVVVESGDPQALLDAAHSLGCAPEVANRLGANGRLYRKTVLDEEHAIDSFSSMLETLIAREADATAGAVV